MKYFVRQINYWKLKNPQDGFRNDGGRSLDRREKTQKIKYELHVEEFESLD